MAIRDLQTLNLKFDQVMFNSLVLISQEEQKSAEEFVIVFTRERKNFVVAFGIFSVLITQINVLESYLDICFKISYDQN